MRCLEYFPLECFIPAIGRKVKFLAFQLQFFLHWCIGGRYYLVIVHIYWIWLILYLNLRYSLCFFNQCLWHSLDLFNLNLFTAFLFLLFFCWFFLCWLFFFLLFHIWPSLPHYFLLWVLYLSRDLILFFATITILFNLLLRLTRSAWLLLLDLFLILFFLFAHINDNLSYAAVLNV